MTTFRTQESALHARHAPGRHRSLKRLGTAVAMSTAMTCVLIFAHPHSVSSQGVHLVKVDVAVVDQGYRVSKLIGQSVINDKNEKVGALDDIVVGRDNSLYGVLQVGGFLGIGSRLVAVPYDALRISDNGRKIELPGASQQELKNLAEVKYPS
jgi:hypothetical protein